MEQLHHDKQDLVTKLEGYLDHFKQRMSQEMKQPDFEPTARKETHGYDGVVTELNNNLDSIGIDKGEIFTSREKTNQLLMSCLQSSADGARLDKDQLTHFFNSSTRRPYHDSKTGEFQPEGKYEVNEVIDSKLLAQRLLKEKEQLKEIQHIEQFLSSWREEHIKAIHAHTLSDFGDTYRPKLTALGIKEAYSFQEMEYIIDQYFYNGRKVYRLIRRSPEKVNEHDLQLYEEVKTDPLFSLLSGGTGGTGRESHIFHTEKLSKTLLEVKNINMIKNVIDSWREMYDQHSSTVEQRSDAIELFYNALQPYTNKKLTIVGFLPEKDIQIIEQSISGHKKDPLYQLLYGGTPYESSHSIDSWELAQVLFMVFGK